MSGQGKGCREEGAGKRVQRGGCRVANEKVVRFSYRKAYVQGWEQCFESRKAESLSFLSDDLSTDK